jgi:hypothetical protein
MTSEQVLMPSEVSSRVGFFDRFAGGAALVASRAFFFAFCVLLVVLWAPTYFLLKDVDTWQLIINTVPTIVTFLLLALLQNTQTRSDQAVQHKLNAIGDGLADLMSMAKLLSSLVAIGSPRWWPSEVLAFMPPCGWCGG